ncbi:hypothetical protein [Lysinibacillus sp. RS5]|uniref:hypothetical protein n=1 Tax=unclassified Lysinibacillus TaxID=2636778 RepID=UPI0035BE66BC
MSKKIIYLTCIMLSFSLISSSVLSFSIANASSMETTNLNSDEKYEIEYLENTDVYQKIKFTNKETGEIEYLEVDLTNENPEYLATYNDKQTKEQTEVSITKEEDSLVIENLTTNEKKTEEIFNLSNENTVLPRALPGGNGDYKLQNTWKGSKSLTDNGTATVSLAAGIIASIYGGLITGVVTTIASYLVTKGAPTFYYIHELYYYKGAPAKPASFVRYYEKSNYTGYIDAVYNNFIWH